eukprot:s212_g13.t2
MFGGNCLQNDFMDTRPGFKGRSGENKYETGNFHDPIDGVVYHAALEIFESNLTQLTQTCAREKKDKARSHSIPGARTSGGWIAISQFGFHASNKTAVVEFYHAAKAWFLQGHDDKARETCEKALKVGDELRPLPVEMGDALHLLGAIHLRQKSLPLAIKCFERALVVKKVFENEEVRPESVEDWCSLMPNLLEADGWHLACSVANSQLMHRSSPWGGRLIKFQLRDIRVKNAPQNAGTLIIRPEVRSLHQRSCSINGINIKSLDFIAPGEAIVHASVSWSLVRLCSVLFGDLAAQVMTCFYDDRATSEDVEQPYEYLILTRPQEEKEMFTVFVIARVYEDRFANWASRYFALVLRQALRMAESCLNRPGVVELRRADERFYVVLSMQSFKRGMPLLPALPGEPCVTDIDAGQPLGLRRWTRFEPDDLENPKFQLSQYLRLFVERLGFPIETFDSWLVWRCFPRLSS